MSDLLQHTISVFLGFFAIMNPIANTAVFVGLTGGQNQASQIKIASKSLLLTFIIITIFAVLGQAIFYLFGISLPALRITGGILIFLIGYQMLQGESSKIHSHHSGNSDIDIAVSPLAVPILAGPGTIATAMNYSATGDWREIAITIFSFAILCLITFVFFIFGQKIVSIIGKSGISIVTRLMGLILAVIGTQMLIVGIFGAISAFSK